MEYLDERVVTWFLHIFHIDKKSCRLLSWFTALQKKNGMIFV